MSRPTEIVPLLRTLVSLPSVNPMGRDVPDRAPWRERRLTDFLEGWLAPLEVQTVRRTVAPGRDNLIALWPGTGGAVHRMLQAHQDTVPAEGMTVDPFAATTADGRLHGRGACDVKGPMAAMLVAFSRVVAERPAGVGPVTLALTVDEEHGFTGVRELVAHGPLPDECVVAEPTSLDVVHAHKGVVRWALEVGGVACHSATPWLGRSAIDRAAECVLALRDHGTELARTVDPLLGPATLSVGAIAGGSAVNVVPDRCRLEIDRRLIPGEGDALATARRFLQDRGLWDDDCRFGTPWVFQPPMAAAGNGNLVRSLGLAIDRVRGAHEVRAVAYATDAGALGAAGVPCVVFGPGSIDQAHTADEWIELSQIDTAAEILHRWLTVG